MYIKPQDIITDILKEDIGVDIQTPSAIDIRTEPEENDLDVKIQGDKEIRFTTYGK